ncbi:AMP-dependent synthetase/ligase [Penicillium herquei]|nr:AMP-dependent synthetase/ligase [Penicillium herquei]
MDTPQHHSVLPDTITLPGSSHGFVDFLKNLDLSIPCENKPLIWDSDFALHCLFQVAWLTTVRPFSTSPTIYLTGEYEKGVSVVAEGIPRATRPQSLTQVSIDSQEIVRDLLDRVINGALRSPKGHPSHGHSKQTEHGTYDTTILYQKGDFQDREQSSDPCTNDEHMVTQAETPYASLRLYISCSEHDQISARIQMNSDNSDIRLATGLLNSFGKALFSICENPNQSIGTVDLMNTQHFNLITGFTSVQASSPPRDALLHALCLTHAISTPDAPAVRSWDGDLTYRELNDHVTRLSHWLFNQGVGPGIFVACAFYKSTWTIVARLAVLMAGGAYICVDAHDPPVYLDSVLERTKIKIILTSVGFADVFNEKVDIRFEVSATSLQTLPYESCAPCSPVTASDPCVVLFTSGSTGTPKGIVQEHRSYTSALTEYIRVTKMGPHTRMFQFDAYAFDISNNDLLAPLIAGGCCCVPTTSLTMEALMTDFADLQANMMFVTPSVAIDIDPDRVPTLKVMCIGGEPASDAVLSKWLHRVQLINQYGMGEAASICAFNAEVQIGHGSVIGRPACGALWIVNPDNTDQLMPVGAIGEILVEGPHIARGYLDPVSGQSDSFLDTPPLWMTQMHPGRQRDRLYRSGDLGRYFGYNGAVELIGRKDSMLKLDGARIEAGQVEHVLNRHLLAGDTAVVDVPGTVDGVSDPILVIFLFLARSHGNSASGAMESIKFQPVMTNMAAYPLTKVLRDAVQQSLPSHYLPSLFLLIDRVPRTKSKKIDRRKLHMLGQSYYLPRREELREITAWPSWD